MTILHSLSGHALVSPITEALANVRTMFERGPDAPLNYSAEFSRELAEVRRKEIGVPAPQVGGRSM